MVSYRQEKMVENFFKKVFKAFKKYKESKKFFVTSKALQSQKFF